MPPEWVRPCLAAEKRLTARVPPAPVGAADRWRADASGALLLKPTRHAAEAARPLAAREAARAPPRTGPPADAASCDYVLLRPRAGTCLLFPGWLHHAVLPLYADGPRVSVAFNTAA